MPSAYAGLTTTLLNNVDAAVQGFTQSAYQGIVQSHQHEIYLVMVLYIALFGYLVLTGGVELSLQAAVRRIIVLAVVTALATHWDIFAVFFNDVFTDGPSKLIAAITGGNFDPNMMLSDVFEKGILAANEINKNAGISTLGFLIVGYSFFFGMLIAVGYALFLLVLAKLALAVLLGLAPLFFMFLLFGSTKDFFASYLRQVFNFALIPVFTSAILGLSLKVVAQAIARLQMTLSAHTGRGGPDCLFVLLCLTVLFLLLHQVMGLASGVAGGLQLHDGNVAGIAARVGSKRAEYPASQARKGLGWVSGKAMNVSRWAYRKAFKKTPGSNYDHTQN